MKKVIALLAVLSLALLPIAFAGTYETEININGVSQGALVNALYTIEAAVTELATDHDADNATVAELVVDHDADNDVLAGWRTAIDELVADHATFKTVVDDLKTLSNGLRTYVNDGMLADGTIVISAVPEKFKTTTTCIYTISGSAYAKVATDNLVFTAADTINTATGAGDFWGVWLVQIDAAGTVSTKSPAADQVYTSEALAIAALPAVDALNVAIGYITVEANNGTDWVANTDDMTAASDCQAANFYDVAVKTVPAAVASSSPATLAAAATTAVAADLTATSVAADLTADGALGSGTVADPSISLT